MSFENRQEPLSPALRGGIVDEICGPLMQRSGYAHVASGPEAAHEGASGLDGVEGELSSVQEA